MKFLKQVHPFLNNPLPMLIVGIYNKHIYFMNAYIHICTHIFIYIFYEHTHMYRERFLVFHRHSSNIITLSSLPPSLNPPSLLSVLFFPLIFRIFCFHFIIVGLSILFNKQKNCSTETQTMNVHNDQTIDKISVLCIFILHVFENGKQVDIQIPLVYDIYHL